MGRLRLTCGTVSGAVAVLGMVLAGPGVDPANKRLVYGAVQEFSRRFTAENGSVICGELLKAAGLATDTNAVPEARSAEYYKKRPCPDLVYSAADILENCLKEAGLL